MSRIGVLPIEIPQGVEVNINQNVISVKGKMGEAKQELKEGIDLRKQKIIILLSRGLLTRKYIKLCMACTGHLYIIWCLVYLQDMRLSLN